MIIAFAITVVALCAFAFGRAVGDEFGRYVGYRQGWRDAVDTIACDAKCGTVYLVGEDGVMITLRVDDAPITSP